MNSIDTTSRTVVCCLTIFRGRARLSNLLRNPRLCQVLTFQLQQLFPLPLWSRTTCIATATTTDILRVICAPSIPCCCLSFQCNVLGPVAQLAVLVASGEGKA